MDGIFSYATNTTYQCAIKEDIFLQKNPLQIRKLVPKCPCGMKGTFYFKIMFFILLDRTLFLL